MAIVTAILSALTSQHLNGSNVTAAAQHLVTGDLAGAQTLMPGTTQALLIHGYSDAFSSVLLILTTITVATAAVVFLFLDRGTGGNDEALECTQDQLA